jgi:hypothetical protein
VTLADAGRKVIFAPGHVRVSGVGVRGIVVAPPPSRSPGSQGHGAGGQGKGQPGAHGKGQGNGLAALALALAATSASSGKVVPSPPDVPGAMTLICSQVLSVAAATFDTQTILGGAIPGTYNHLLLVMQGRTSSSGGVLYDGVLLRFNNDSGANYYRISTEIKGSAAVSSLQVAGDTRALVGKMTNTSGLAGEAGTLDAMIVGYTSGFNKNVRSRANVQYAISPNTSWELDEFASYWQSTAAITRITALNDGAGGTNFIAGSTFYLYGIT